MSPIHVTLKAGVMPDTFSATLHIKNLAFAKIKQEYIYSLGPDSSLYPLSVLRA